MNPFTTIVSNPLPLAEVAPWRMHDEAPLPELSPEERRAIAYLRDSGVELTPERIKRGAAYLAAVDAEAGEFERRPEADKPFEEPRQFGLTALDLEVLATQLTGLPSEPITCVAEHTLADQVTAAANEWVKGRTANQPVATRKARHARVVVDLTHNLVSLQVRTVREDRIAWVTRWRKTAAGAKAARELAEAWTAKLAERNWRVWETRFFYARERLTVIQAGRTVRVREDREGGAVKYDRRCTTITEARALLAKLQARLDAANIPYRTYQPQATQAVAA